MCRWPSTTPGSVSTSRSRSVSFCLCAKLRTCAWANLMSSRSRLRTCPIACSTSSGVSLNDGGDQLSNFCDRSRTAVSLRASISARIFSTVSRTLASAALIAVASMPRLRCRAITLSPVTVSLNRLRIDRRAGTASDDERRAAKEEFIDAVVGAIVGEFLQIKDFAHAKPHRWDDDPVPRLVGLLGLIWANFDPPGIGADRGDFFFLAPVAVFEFHAGRVAAGIAAPVLFGETTLHLAGADDDEIAAADRDILILGAFVEFIIGNALAVGHPFDAAVARDVDEHAAPDHFVFGMLDAKNVQTLGVDQLGVVTVIGLVLIKDMPERIPMRRALHAQHQRIVGIADLVPILPLGDGVGAGGEHLMDRIEAATE